MTGSSSRQAAIDWLIEKGCPALPVAPAQPADQYPARDKQGQVKTDKNGDPIPAFTGKNPSYLDPGGKPILVNHHRYQSELPSATERQQWFRNPANGIGTLGGWSNIYWIDFDTKQFNSQADCDAAAAAIIKRLPRETWTEKTHSGGYHVAVRLSEPPGFTNFALEPGGRHVGEVLGEGRFTVLAPTIGPSGQPYVRLSDVDPVEVESLKSIGIYSTRKPKADRTATPRPIQQQAGSIDLAELGNAVSRRVLNGEDIKGDRSNSLTGAICEWAGWANWCNSNGVGFSSSVEDLARTAGNAFGIDGDRVERILTSVDLASCLPAAQIKGGDESCWLKIRRLDRRTYKALCPKSIALEIEEKREQTEAEISRDFPFTVVDALYYETSWICVSGRLYRYTGRGYEYQTDEKELKRIQRLAESISYFNERKDKEVFPYAKVSVIKNALEWVKIKFAVNPDECNPPGINCTNGVRVWDNSKGEFELLPHSPDRYYLYEPLATYAPDASTEDCDRLLAALDPEQLQILLRTVAAAIDLPLVRKRRGRGVRALLCRGIGSNGKDAHREALSMLWGRSGCVSVAFEDFAQYDSGRKFPLAGLRTARLNWASENNGSINLDRLQSLKKAITGDPLHFELKGQDHSEFVPNAVQIFNVNDIPRLGAAQEAIRSRFAVLDYSKVYKINADKSRGELEADPRLKYDPEFIQAKILPALLNKVEQAFKDLLAEGIDYSTTEAALEEVQSFNCHLWDFVRSVGLEPDPTGTVAVAEVWSALESWYKTTGVLEVETTNFNKEVRTWAEPIRSGDQYIKGANQVYKRLLELFAGLKQFDMGGNRKGIKGLRFALAATQPTPEPEATPTAAAQPNSVQPIKLDSQPEPESATVARYVIAFKQAASQSVGFGEDKRLVQLIEELKPCPLFVRQAIWQQLPSELTRQINQILKRRPDLAREKVGASS